jgi:hypothetical protein
MSLRDRFEQDRRSVAGIEEIVHHHEAATTDREGKLPENDIRHLRYPIRTSNTTTYMKKFPNKGKWTRVDLKYLAPPTSPAAPSTTLCEASRSVLFF